MYCGVCMLPVLCGIFPELRFQPCPAQMSDLERRLQMEEDEKEEVMGEVRV